MPGMVPLSHSPASFPRVGANLYVCEGLKSPIFLTDSEDRALAKRMEAAASWTFRDYIRQCYRTAAEEVHHDPQLLSRISFSCSDARSLPFHDDSFEGGICSFGLGYVAEWEKALSELMRVVKEEAPVVVLHPSKLAKRVPYGTRYLLALNGQFGHFVFPEEMRDAPASSEIAAYAEGAGARVERIDGPYRSLMDVLVLRKGCLPAPGKL